MDRIRSILIVGGGTAGWLSAAFLQRALGDTVEITLVESSSASRIGVGEATFPTLVRTLQFIGVDEKEWMARCNATFKLAVRFDNWLEDPASGRKDTYYHPFLPRPEPLILPYERPFFPVVGEGFLTSQWWMKRALEGRFEEYAYLASPVPRLCDELRFGKPEETAGALTYAYQMDAALLGEFLRELSVGRGVQHVIGHVEGAPLDDRGFIKEVRTKDGRSLKADLYLDCTGFSGLLINQALGEPFVSHAKYLINDRAVAFQVPADYARHGMRPYTTATALSSGWMWNIPLFHRIGCGYVYSSQFLSPDEAEREMRTQLGPSADGIEASHLRIRVGACQNLWTRNCVAIGLSGSFIEPLESTSIFFTEYQLAWLVALFPDRTMPAAVIRRYNENVLDVYHQIRDFIALHFCLTRREDTPYWRAIRHEVKIPDSLAAFLDDYDSGLLPPETQKLYIFRSNSITSILSGMKRLPQRSSGILDHVNGAAAERHFARVAEQTKRLVATLPDHHSYIASLHAANKGG